MKVASPQHMKGKVLRIASFSVYNYKPFFYLCPPEKQSEWEKDKDTFNWLDVHRQANEIAFVNKWAPYRDLDIVHTPDENDGFWSWQYNGETYMLVNSDGTRVQGGKVIH
jgi:hypothetical protein